MKGKFRLLMVDGSSFLRFFQDDVRCRLPGVECVGISSYEELLDLVKRGDLFDMIILDSGQIGVNGQLPNLIQGLQKMVDPTHLISVSDHQETAERQVMLGCRFILPKSQLIRYVGQELAIRNVLQRAK